MLSRITSDFDFDCADFLSESDRAKVVTHYELVAPLLEATLGGTPLTSVYLPCGFGSPEVRVDKIRSLIPDHLPTVTVKGRRWNSVFMTLSAESILWRVRTNALSFECWSPLPADLHDVRFGIWNAQPAPPMKVRFAHITLAGQGNATVAMLRHAATTIREFLNVRGVDVCIVLDGPNIVLWIPIDGAPTDLEIHTWLQAVVSEAKSREPDLFESDPTKCDARVRICMTPSLPGYGVRLPYAIIPGFDLGLALPITWCELQTMSWNTFNIDNVKSRMVVGDIFAAEIARIGAQRLAYSNRPTSQTRVEVAPPYLVSRPDHDLLLVVCEIFADGKKLSVGQIMEEAAERDLWPQAIQVEYVLKVMRSYIEATKTRGAWPYIVERDNGFFRIDMDGDDLFRLIESYPPESGPRDIVDGLIAGSASRLNHEFVRAVESAFAQLGFHLVDPGDGDGSEFFLDAQLGALGYRVVVRCAAGSRPISQRDLARCIRFRNAYLAEYAVIVSPGFEEAEDAVVADAKFEGIRLWRVKDLIAILERRPDLQELSVLFSAKGDNELLVELELSTMRRKRRRSATIATAIATTGFTAQRRSAEFRVVAQSPLLTEAAGLELVEDWLRSRGSLVKVDSADIRDAFDYLADPRVGAAAWISERGEAIALLHDPSRPRS